MDYQRPLSLNHMQTSLHALMSRFRKSEAGSVTIFAVFLIVMMLGIMGIAVDFMRAERNRTVLQHTLDRAILAAADLDQQRPPEEVVQDYFEAAGLESTLAEVSAEQGLNYKSLYARAEVNTHAPWLDLLGRWDQNRAAMKNGREVGEDGRLIAREECEAETEVLEVPKLDDEGNPVLDANGDPVMTRPTQTTFQLCDGTKSAHPGPAAPKVASMLASAQGAAEERVQNVEISLVLDISGSMAEGNKMPELRTAAKAFVDAVLKPSTEGLVSVSLIPYSQHVNIGPDIFNELNTIHRHNYSHCVEMSDSAYNSTALNLGTTYDQMQHFQWNYSGSNSLTDTICPRYSYERIKPLSQNATALKTQIDQLQPRAGTQIFMGMKWAAAMLDPAFNPVVSALVNDGKIDNDFSDRPAALDDIETLKTVVLMTDGKNSSAARISSWAYDSNSDYAHWANYNLWYYLQRYVSHHHRGQFYWTKYSAYEGDLLLDNICDASKAAGMVIWSIGFEVDDHGANVMRQCASSPSHFFRVEGIEISDAFAAIARQINQLRLTQ